MELYEGLLWWFVACGGGAPLNLVSIVPTHHLFTLKLPSSFFVLFIFLSSHVRGCMELGSLTVRLFLHKEFSLISYFC